MSVAKKRSGGMTITHADPRILVDSEHLYLIIEGKAPSWLTLVAPSPKHERKVADCDDIRETGAGAFVDWSVHVTGDDRTIIYRLGAYRSGNGVDQADRTDR